MTRCPFSLSRLVKVTDTGQVVYKAEKQACRAFADPRGDGLESGPKRNFQILSPLDFLAEFTQHIPPKGAHLINREDSASLRPLATLGTEAATGPGGCGPRPGRLLLRQPDGILRSGG